MEKLLPHAIASNGFVQQMVHPSFSQVQAVLGYDQGRPKAPFSYTNEWGGALALLTPIALASWVYVRSARWRLLVLGCMCAAVVPLVHSLDRGLWIAIGLGIGYGLVRLAQRGRVRALAMAFMGLLLVGGLLFTPPMRTMIESRIAHPHSNQGRARLYTEAWQGVQQRPIFGYGGPRPSTVNPNLPSVGTQGMFWTVLYSHGFPGVALYLGWFVFLFLRTRRFITFAGFWCHVTLAIGLVLFPVYDGLPSQLYLVMIPAALALREEGWMARARARQRLGRARRGELVSA
jgi:O-antigen ligase